MNDTCAFCLQNKTKWKSRKRGRQRKETTQVGTRTLLFFLYLTGHIL